MKTALSGIGIILVLITLGACSGSRYKDGSPVKSDEESTPALEVTEWDWGTGQFGNKVIVGKIRNNSTKKYSYAQITFILMDNEGNQVGSALANVNNLEPGSTWKFEAAVLHATATKAKIGEVTGF